MTSGHDDTLLADDAPLTARLAAGTLFADRYEVEGLLGAGGMGAVYRVRDRRLDETVALKVLTLESGAAVERFHSEVKLARRVTHPNVARTHDLGEHAGVHYLTMEYVSGEPLDAVLARAGKLDPARVREIGTAIATGLQAAHDAGVIHRDLKPANVLVADDGRVVLTDFGIARLGASSHRTGILGTPAYMSPEQVAGRPIDTRSDIYALGLILFEMATGTLPFAGETPLAMALARLGQPVPDPRTRASVPEPLARLILRCLARLAEKRPPRARDVAAMLTDGTVPSPTTVGEVEPFAPIALGSRSLAVLPFTYRGPSEHTYLGEGLAEELIDVLARTRGLRVLSLSATRKHAEDRDPATVCSALSATALVDGTLQVAGPRVRLAARLLQPDGLQVWSEHFDGAFEDVFALQETMARRVAEALRVELDAVACPNVPKESVDLYLRARSDLRRASDDSEAAIVKLERALSLAPEFRAAIACHATASVRAWWAVERDEEGERARRAEASVARASREAGEVAETHLATAMWAVQRGEYRVAVQALAEALHRAPTMYDAHQYLGRLQIETGRVDEGRHRVELALELNPTSTICHLAMAGLALGRGDLAAFRRHDAALGELLPNPTLPILVARIRWSLFVGDRDRAVRNLEQLERLPILPAQMMSQFYAPLRDADAVESSLGILDQLPAWLDNPRFASFIHQASTELFTACGELDVALKMLRRAAEGITIDVPWVQSSNLLAPLRCAPEFPELEAMILRRAAEVWR